MRVETKSCLEYLEQPKAGRCQAVSKKTPTGFTGLELGLQLF